MQVHCQIWLFICKLMSVRLWNFKDGGSLKARFLANQHKGMTVRQKLGMISEKKVVQISKFKKKKFLTKNPTHH